MSSHSIVRDQIAAFTDDESIRAELVDMLGLDITDGPMVLVTSRPDPFAGRRTELGMSAAAVGASANLGRPSAGDPLLQRPKLSTAPESLRNLPPVVVPPKPVAKPRPLTSSQQVGPPQERNQALKQPCGTEAAAKRHVAAKEPVCDVCLAGRDARNAWKNGTGVRKARAATATCGSGGGYARHKREKTSVCDPCREARNARARQTAARKRQEGTAA